MFNQYVTKFVQILVSYFETTEIVSIYNFEKCH